MVAGQNERHDSMVSFRAICPLPPGVAAAVLGVNTSPLPVHRHAPPHRRASEVAPKEPSLVYSPADRPTRASPLAAGQDPTKSCGSPRSDGATDTVPCVDQCTPLDRMQHSLFAHSPVGQRPPGGSPTGSRFGVSKTPAEAVSYIEFPVHEQSGR